MSLTLIEHLRTKPKHVRTHVSLLAALCTTGLVAVIWSVTLPSRLSDVPLDGVANVVETKSGLDAFFSSAQANFAQLAGWSEGVDSADDAGVETSASGAYQVGAPVPTDPYGGYGFDKPAAPVIPISAREVRIATSTKAR